MQTRIPQLIRVGNLDCSIRLLFSLRPFELVVPIGSAVTNIRPKASSSPARQWGKGEPLSFAWFAFATPATKLQYQDCEIDSRRMSHRLDMKFDIVDDLVAGKLIAWGFREGAPVDEGLVMLPARCGRERDPTNCMPLPCPGLLVFRPSVRMQVLIGRRHEQLCVSQSSIKQRFLPHPKRHKLRLNRFRCRFRGTPRHRHSASRLPSATFP